MFWLARTDIDSIYEMLCRWLWLGVCSVSRLPPGAGRRGPGQTRPDRLLRGVDARRAEPRKQSLRLTGVRGRPKAARDKAHHIGDRPLEIMFACHGRVQGRYLPRQSSRKRVSQIWMPEFRLRERLSRTARWKVGHGEMTSAGPAQAAAAQLSAARGKLLRQECWSCYWRDGKAGMGRLASSRRQRFRKRIFSKARLLSCGSIGRHFRRRSGPLPGPTPRNVNFGVG